MKKISISQLADQEQRGGVKLNLTPEYPPEVKPMRVGVYKTRIPRLNTCGYSLWDGRQWGGEYLTIAKAKSNSDTTTPDQNKHWQGLADDPDKRGRRNRKLVTQLTELADHTCGAAYPLLLAAIEALKETT